jgi:hypothetical protein
MKLVSKKEAESQIETKKLQSLREVQRIESDLTQTRSKIDADIEALIRMRNQAQDYTEVFLQEQRDIRNTLLADINTLKSEKISLTMITEPMLKNAEAMQKRSEDNLSKSEVSKVLLDDREERIDLREKQLEKSTQNSSELLKQVTQQLESLSSKVITFNDEVARFKESRLSQESELTKREQEVRAKEEIVKMRESYVDIRIPQLTKEKEEIDLDRAKVAHEKLLIIKQLKHLHG